MSSNGIVYRVFPTADPRALKDRIDELVDAITTGQLRGLEIIEEGRLQYPQIESRLISFTELQKLSEDLTSISRELAPRSVDEFDRELSSRLFESMQVVPFQASDDIFWESMSVFVFPEIVPLRFGTDPKKIRGRFQGGRRNALARLWLRRKVISEEQEEKYKQILKQDLVQQLVERPNLASSSELVEIILHTVQSRNLNAAEQRELYRELTKEVTLLGGLMVPELVSSEEISDFLRSKLAI